MNTLSRERGGVWGCKFELGAGSCHPAQKDLYLTYAAAHPADVSWPNRVRRRRHGARRSHVTCSRQLVQRWGKGRGMRWTSNYSNSQPVQSSTWQSRAWKDFASLTFIARHVTSSNRGPIVSPSPIRPCQVCAYLHLPCTLASASPVTSSFSDGLRPELSLLGPPSSIVHTPPNNAELGSSVSPIRDSLPKHHPLNKDALDSPKLRHAPHSTSPFDPTLPLLALCRPSTSRIFTLPP